MRNRFPALPINSLFFIVQAFTVMSLSVKGAEDQALEALITLTLYLLFIYLEQLWQFKIENWVRLALILTIIANSGGGHFLGGYNTKYFDKILHFFGSFSAASFAFSVINKIFHVKYSSRAVMFIFISAVGLAIGALYEILEYSLDRIFLMNNQLGLSDTNLDLIADALGSLASAVYITFISGNKTPLTKKV
ncbi:MAG: hypothetical protein ACOWWO_05150 [Peptococcaceae bacterium]